MNKKKGIKLENVMLRDGNGKRSKTDESYN